MNLNRARSAAREVRLDVAYSYFRDVVIYCDGCDMVFTLDDCIATKE